MDALSTVLSTLRVNSILSTRFEAEGDWSLRFPEYRHIKFGSVLSGRVYLWLEDTAPIVMEAGDFYLLTNGKPFFTASDSTRRPEDGVHAIRSSRGEEGISRYLCSGKGLPVSIAAGRFTFENEMPELLVPHLPPLIHLKGTETEGTALSSVLALLRLESGRFYPGAEIARSSLASLTLVMVLRAFLETSPQQMGWLGALSDSRIGKALSAMHLAPERKWTLESLAEVAAMSRTAFTNRFREMVGKTPLNYLWSWRMVLAENALKETNEPLTGLAYRIGYLSETAFSLAFKRYSGISPGHFRIHYQKKRP